jgi:hypothetical protein
MKVEQPSIEKRSFNCPHCGALAQQFWWKAYGSRLNPDKIPLVVRDYQKIDHSKLSDGDREWVLEYGKRKQRGAVFVQRHDDGEYLRSELENLNLSRCYHCDEFSVWIDDKLVWPAIKTGAAPNEDLGDEIKRDFNEARTIVELSPRGAAALLRLCIQKLCQQLGENGKNLNDDIASLVAKGLSPQIQKALDLVRVIGNNAVHPGVIDLKDDVATASKLFQLINLIAETMITQPKQVASLYGGLPDEILKEIAKRDAVNLSANPKR